MAAPAVLTIDDLPPDAIERAQQRITKLERLWNASSDAKRRRRSRRLRLAYEGDQQVSTSLVPRMPRESDANFASRPKLTPNVLRRCINELSYVYNEEVIRRGAGEDSTERWNDVLWRHGPGLSAVLDEIDPYVRLLGTVLVMLEHDAEHPMRRGLGLRWFAPEDVCVLTPRGRPHEIEAVAILRHVEPRAVARTKRDLCVWEYWDDQVQCWVEGPAWGRNWEVVSNELGELWHAHGYGRAPIVPLRNAVTRRGRSFWGGGWGGPDLLPNVRALNHVITEFLRAIVLQRGQPWISGDLQKDSVLAIAPEFIWRLKPGSTAGFAQGGANLAGMESGIMLLFEAFALGNDLPASTLRLKQAIVESGRAILVRAGMLREDAKRRTSVVRGWERDIHTAGSDVWFAHEAERLDPWIETEFPEGTPVLTVEERLSVVGFLLEQGLITREKGLRMVLNHLSPEEVETLLEDAEAELEKRQEAELAKAGRLTPGTDEEGVEPVLAPEGDVQKQALNGAQGEMMANFLKDVTLGVMSREAAQLALEVAFPSFDSSVIKQMVGAAAAHTPPEDVVPD